LVDYLYDAIVFQRRMDGGSFAFGARITSSSDSSELGIRT
jgi:hypothetical protein